LVKSHSGTELDTEGIKIHRKKTALDSL